MADEKLQEKYIVFQLLQQNMEALKQQMAMVEQQFMEMRETLNALGDIGKSGQDEILFPLGSGCFGSGKLSGKDSFMVNVGAGVFVERTTEDVKKLLSERETELEAAGRQITGNIERVSESLNLIAEEINKMAGKG